MCKCCEGDSSDRELFFEPISGDWYLNHRTSEFDENEMDYNYDKIFVSYCPYCGRKLTNEEEVNATAADILYYFQKVFLSKKRDDVKFRISYGSHGCCDKVIEYIRSRYNV